MPDSSPHPNPGAPGAPEATGPRGRLIVLEGIDGAGTTTQTAAVTAALRAAGHPAVSTREPSDGPVGLLIRLALSGRLTGSTGALHDSDRSHGDGERFDARALALLFAADRVDHVASQVEPNLRAGRHVVCDRYLLSSLAYQALELDEAWVLEINRQAVTPDLTLYLDLPAEEAAERMRGRGGTRDLYEEEALQRRIRGRYLDVVRRGLSEVGPVVVVDATLPVAEVTRAVLETVRERLGIDVAVREAVHAGG